MTEEALRAKARRYLFAANPVVMVEIPGSAVSFRKLQNIVIARGWDQAEKNLHEIRDMINRLVLEMLIEENS